jgi:hypothetical protein
MKNVIFSLLVLWIAGSPVGAQKVINDLNVQKRAVPAFHGIDVSTGITLWLTEGSSEEVAVSASDAEFRDKIVTKVENGILKIHYDNKIGSINKRKESKDLKAYVSYKTLDRLHVNAGAEVKINGVLKTSSLDLEANSGAQVDGEVSIGSLKVNQNTGSKITLSGKADKLEVEGDTGSKFRGDDLVTETSEVFVKTGAQVYINAEKAIQAKANSGGLVRYKGKASMIDIRTASGGSVKKI